MSETPQDNSPDAAAEEVLRELEHDALCHEISRQIGKFSWYIMEEKDPTSGLKRYVLMNEYGRPLWWINHANKGVAALVVQAFVAGALQGRDEEREVKKDLFDKLERWRPLPSREVN